jgi:hypothetical protein
MHCKSARNECYGIGECFCECERCLDADDEFGYEASDVPGIDAAGNCFSDADPGL